MHNGGFTISKHEPKPNGKFFAQRQRNADARAESYRLAVANGGTFIHSHLHTEPFAIGVEHTHSDSYTGAYSHRHSEPLAHFGSPTLHAPADPSCDRYEPSDG